MTRDQINKACDDWSHDILVGRDVIGEIRRLALVGLSHESQPLTQEGICGKASGTIAWNTPPALEQRVERLERRADDTDRILEDLTLRTADTASYLTGLARYAWPMIHAVRGVEGKP